MELSIIIVNWNTRDLLAQCLDSIYANAPQCTFEVWVVDNASSDGSAQMVRARFPHVRLIENDENVGFARANNQAIAQSTGRYLLLLNSDAAVRPDCIANMVTFLDKHPSAGAVGPLYVNADGSFQASYAVFPRIATTVLEVLGYARQLLGPHFPSKGPDESRLIQPVDWVPGTCMMVRAEMILNVGCLDEGFFLYSEEVDWCYRMWQKGWGVWFNPESVVIHKLGRSASRVPLSSLWHLYRGKVRFFAKHKSAHHVWLLKTTLLLVLWAKGILAFIQSLTNQNNKLAWYTYIALAARIVAEPTRIHMEC